MDYDSSTKFISSLAKFLQSLCNGYVEFDNGVQVIGHLYLSVDTGKTIDYILNEKVCKTDENSVTFISNSFHAQPAERPKPQGKKTVDKGETKSEDVNDILGGQTEPKSTNYGTLPPRGTQNSPHSQNLKRSFSPSSKQPRGDGSPSKLGRSSPRNKKSRTESVDHNLSQVSNPASENSISSQPSPAADVGAPPTVSAQSADASQTTPYNETYQQSFFQPGDDENSMADDTEERDIKPSIDTDVTFIKEEFGTSSCSQSGNQNRDRGHGDDSSVYPSMYHSNQTFSTTNFQTGFASTPSSSHRSNFNASGDNRSSLYTSGSSQLDTGESSGDPSGPLNLGIERNNYGAPSHLRSSEMLGVNSGGSNFLAWTQRRMSYPPSPLLGGNRISNNFSIQDSSGSSPAYSSNTPCSSYRRLSRDVHGNTMFSTCSKCGGKYTNPGMCASHQVNCNGTNRLMCHICKRVYSQMCALKEHLRGKHGLGEMLSCKQCGRSFKYKPQLYDHSCTGMGFKEKQVSRSRDSSLLSLNQFSKELSVHPNEHDLIPDSPGTIHSVLQPTNLMKEDE